MDFLKYVWGHKKSPSVIEKIVSETETNLLYAGLSPELAANHAKIVGERIATLIDAQIQAIEGERREPTLCGICNLNGKLCKECYANRRANAALDAAIGILKGYTASI